MVVYPMTMHPGFQRHIDACNNVVLPGERIAFRLAGHDVGWLTPAFAALLSGHGAALDATGCELADPAALPVLARTLAMQGHYRFRDEAFDVRARSGGAVLSTIDRGALPSFGIVAEGVHVNGLVRRADGLHLWVARRAADKLLDPGKLDHIVAGGISAGMTAEQTLLKEAGEEASLPPALAALATYRSTITYAMQRREGLRRDRLHCYDLELPDDFMPEGADGEVESFELWPIARALAAVRDTDDFKFNVSLVLIDLFRRLGLPLE